MRKDIGLLLVLWLVQSCTSADNEWQTTESTREIMLSVAVEEPITIYSRASEKTILYYSIFDEQGNLVQQIAGENGDTQVTLNKEKTYKCYAVMAYDDNSVKPFMRANTEKKIRELTLAVEEEDVEDQKLVLTGYKEIKPNEEEIQIRVHRLYAKIEITFNTDELSPDYNYNLLSVKAYNVPKQVYYFEPQDQEAATQFFPEPIELEMTGAEYVLHMLENCAGGRVEVNGDSGNWTNQKEKKTYAPENATYVCVEGEMKKEGRTYKTNHWIYLGKNSSDDYNVGRNHRQSHLLRIKGFSEDDSRVEVIEEYMF